MKAKYGRIALSTMLAAASILTQGCLGSDDSGTGVVGSCTVESSGFTTCIDYTGSSYNASAAQAGCTSSSGTYSASACTSTGRIGTCTVYSGQATEQKIRYLTGYNSTTASAACSAMTGGTYEAG